MSAQEEMLQSLIHNLSKEFIDFRAQNAPPSKKKGKKKEAGEGEGQADGEPSFID